MDYFDNRLFTFLVLDFNLNLLDMNCYVYNPYKKYSLPDEIMDKSITMFYPEKAMTMDDQFNTSRPRDFHIVTDSPFLVSLYKRHEVFYLERGKWVNPDFQTYGCSYDCIMNRLWKYGQSIPQAVLNGKVTNCMGNKVKYK